MSSTPAQHGSSTPAGRDDTIWSGPYLTTTIGAFAMIVLVAFESLAVTTVMPDVARILDGQALYASAFAAPLASGVVGMVAAGMWSDRRGPGQPLVTAFVMFSIGLLVCGLSTSMEMLIVGRVLQGLGGGAATVVLYVLVGLVYPARLQPAIFAVFAAAWVLPSLFGPFLAAVIADAFGWRWVFLGTVFIVAAAIALLVPVVRSAGHPAAEVAEPAAGRLAWAALAAAAVLGIEILADLPVVAIGCGVVALATLTRLLPARTLRLGRGLPSVIATRGLLSAGFFCAEAYIVYVLQEKWGMTAAAAGVALTLVGLMWALGSQAQARTPGVTHPRAMLAGTTITLVGLVVLAVVVATEPPAWLAIGAYVFAGAGMGYGYPRTGVAMLAYSTDADRGFNSSALSIADSLGAALALSLTGLVFAASERNGLDPFLSVFVMATAITCLSVVASSRTAAVAAE